VGNLPEGWKEGGSGLSWTEHNVLMSYFHMISSEKPNNQQEAAERRRILFKNLTSSCWKKQTQLVKRQRSGLKQAQFPLLDPL